MAAVFMVMLPHGRRARCVMEQPVELTGRDRPAALEAGEQSTFLCRHTDVVPSRTGIPTTEEDDFDPTWVRRP
jgi:hypothetical protein